MIRLTLIMIAVSWAVASSALADHTLPTSGDYQAYCQESIKVYDGKPADQSAAGICLGFVEGAMEMHAALNASDGATPFYCMSEHGISGFDAILTWNKYLKNHQDELGKSPIITFVLAIREAFPCPETQPAQ